jgi:aconitate hydratase
MLKGKSVHPDVSMTVSPGSRAVMAMVGERGGLSKMVAAGARILECACGPCIGMGQSPPSGAVTLRTFNRNFEGRSGTADAGIYLCSPAVAVAAALKGEPGIEIPAKMHVDESGLIFPPEDGSDVEIVRGPNIKPIPVREAMPDVIEGDVLLVVEDNITTDHIMPAGARILPLRSNIPAIS